ncbi:MAG: hypothetical protein JJU21_03090 [Salinarimonas sp.]|nr:hypothetical protein [Salinarimonas sp.]
MRFKVGFWREEWKAPDVYEMKTLYHNLTEAAKARQIERAEIAKKRSAEGKMVIRERDERIARERARAVLADAKRAREVAEQAIERAAERRAGLELSAAKISSSDYAGALRRERIRTKLEAMDPKSQREALAHLHPDVVAALAEMPLQFSPVSPDIYMTTLERAFEKEHGETLAELEAIEQAAEVTLQAAKGGEVIAKESLADNLMLAPQEVDAVASEIMGG